MLLSAICALALQQQDQSQRTDGPEHRVLMGIYQEHSVYLNSDVDMQDPNTPHGVTYDCLGLCSWSVSDGRLHGTYCKLYDGESNWNYTTTDPKTSAITHHAADLKVHFEVDEDTGRVAYSESHFLDNSDKGDYTIDLIATYKKDYVDETISNNGNSYKTTVYPTDGMGSFSAMFQPMMTNGLISQKEVVCDIIHPFTGMPYKLKVSVTGRFTGQYFFLPQEGYSFDVEGAEGNETGYLTREGQLLKCDMENKVDIEMMEGPLVDERRDWGHFDTKQWNQTADDSNPLRPLYHSLVLPVPIKNPRMVVPVPFTLTD